MKKKAFQQDLLKPFGSLIAVISKIEGSRFREFYRANGRLVFGLFVQFLTAEKKGKFTS